MHFISCTMFRILQKSLKRSEGGRTVFNFFFVSARSWIFGRIPSFSNETFGIFSNTVFICKNAKQINNLIWMIFINCLIYGQSIRLPQITSGLAYSLTSRSITTSKLAATKSLQSCSIPTKISQAASKTLSIWPMVALLVRFSSKIVTKSVQMVQVMTFFSWAWTEITKNVRYRRLPI